MVAGKAEMLVDEMENLSASSLVCAMAALTAKAWGILLVERWVKSKVVAMVDEMGADAAEMWVDWMVAWMVYFSVASKVVYLVLLSAA